MASQSKIEWTTDATWNPIRARRISVHGPSASVGWHCEKVSEGCANCYAETMNKRIGTGLDFKPCNRDKVELFLDEKMLHAPLHWRKPRRISVCSMTDLFADFVPDEWIDRIFAVMALSPQHVFPVSTKRTERMLEYFSYEGRASRVWASALKFRGCTEPWPIPNLWLGASCEDQATADSRIPDLLATPAAVRFVACEPMLRPISFRWAKWDNWRDTTGIKRPSVNEYDGLRMIDQIICSGEAGHGARPMDIAWVRSIVAQCKEAGVPCFVKQLGLRPYSTTRDSYFKLWSLSDKTDSGPFYMSKGHAKGGDPEEWPLDLRVRELPL